MRILFTFIGGVGHFEPLVPIARAAQAAGHSVAFGCGPSMAKTVESAGFTGFRLGTGAASALARLPLRPVDIQREEEEFHDRFVRRGAFDRAPLTLDLCEAWRPDVLVCDEADFGGMVAAERLGLPHATVLVTAAGSFVRPDTVQPALDELRAAHDLPPDPALVTLDRYLVLSPFPPSFRDPAFPLPPTARSIRPLERGAGFLAGPSGPGSDQDRLESLSYAEPTVYFTLGTVFNLESGDLFARVLEGLRDLPILVVVTVGRHIDPAEFGPQPAHIHIERYIPQALILPRCAAVVSHGGSGSVVGALAHGLPSVLIPMGADQPHNAARCAELGVARALDPVTATPAAVSEAVSSVLTESSYRQAAQRFASEIARLPGPEHGVTLLEQLVAK